MIARYSRDKLKNIWTDENKFLHWFKVECAVLEALESKRIIPKNTTKNIIKKSKIKVSRILEIEKTTHHDVIAFSTSIAEQCGEHGKYFHYGLTSSDVVDTALSLLFREAIEEINNGLVELLSTLKKLSKQYKKTLCIGRTHGVHAEPTSFGLKFLGWYAEIERQIKRCEEIKAEISFGKLSGAVGAYGQISPEIEKVALKKLNLKIETVSTQILPRDRHAMIFTTLANIGGSIERISLELRHLQRTEVRELEEGFSAGQKGSSAMPHKKNPIAAENLSGCARLLRGYALSGLENIALWHERDISHSSVERVIAPDATILLDYMINRLNLVLKNLKIYPKNILKNLNLTHGIYFSGTILTKLVDLGLTREDAYVIVQSAAHKSWNEDKEYIDVLWENAQIKKFFKHKELMNLMNAKSYLKHIDVIYERTLGKK